MIETAKLSGLMELDHILASAVVLNWEALVSSEASGRVRVEYRVGRDGGVECMKLWGSAREYWSLICDYKIAGAWSDGPRFQNGFHSHTLGRLLQSIMMNQNLFEQRHLPNSEATIDIIAPTAEDTENARQLMNHVFEKSS